ncbi:tRNA-binding protein [Brevundimonas naejangsanensis]|uniref:tRNA-binding protein n=1 Tax=Brevundimonas naejangsanensis TaxID=588932 RepID=UPI003209BA7E
MTEPAAFDQFLAIDVRVGTIIQVDAFPEARKPAWKLTIDLGPDIGLKRSSAQIVELYEESELVGRQVACVVNLGTRRIGPFTSEVLTLGFPDQQGRVILVQPERTAPNGGRMF